MKLNPAKEQALERLAAGVEALCSSDAWQAHLAHQARFHHYSFRNSLLIALQMPEATQVAGFRRWQEMGRQVRKGEKALYILAPLAYSQTDEETGEKVRALRGWRMVAVFDVSQTDGDELPELPMQRLRGEAPASVWAGLVAVAEGLGYRVEEVAECLGHPGANGVTWFSERLIEVLATNEPAQRVKTLCHELGHALLHDPDGGSGAPLSDRRFCELEAESVAFVVCDALGLASDDYSFGYVASWAGGEKAAEAIQSSGSRIQRAADRVLEALSQAPDLALGA